MFSEDFLLNAKKWTRWQRQWVKIVVPKPLIEWDKLFPYELASSAILKISQATDTRSLQSSDYMQPKTSHYGYEITNQYKAHQSGPIFEEKRIQPSENHGIEKQKDPSN